MSFSFVFLDEKIEVFCYVASIHCFPNLYTSNFEFPEKASTVFLSLEPFSCRLIPLIRTVGTCSLSFLVILANALPVAIGSNWFGLPRKTTLAFLFF